LNLGVANKWLNMLSKDIMLMWEQIQNLEIEDRSGDYHRAWDV